MADYKELQTRIITRHDTEANWKTQTWIPLEGEVIIYDPDYHETDKPNGYKYPRFKVGDGVNIPDNLMFASMPDVNLIISDYTSEPNAENKYVLTGFKIKNDGQIEGTFSKALSDNLDTLANIVTEDISNKNHTHNVSINGTTSNNSGNAVLAATAIGIKSSASAAPANHTHSYDKITAVTLSSTDTQGTGAISYVSSISGTAPSLTGTTTFIKDISEGSGHLKSYDSATAGTEKVASGRIQYIHSVSKDGYTPAGSVTLTNGTAPSMGNAGIKYLHLNAGTTPPSGATPQHTSTASQGNSGDPKTVVSGYSSFSGGSLTGTTTFNTDAIKSIGGTANYGFSASTSNVMTTPTVIDGVLIWTVVNANTQDAHTGINAPTATVGFTPASLGSPDTVNVAPSGHTHKYDKTTAISLTNGTAPSLTSNTTSTNGIKYVETQGTFSPGTTPKQSAQFSGTQSTDVVTGATTYYLDHSHTASSGTEGTIGIKDGSYSATFNYLTATPNHTSNNTASNSGTNVTAVTDIEITSTANAAPHSHNHTYGSSSPITTSADNSYTATANEE